MLKSNVSLPLITDYPTTEKPYEPNDNMYESCIPYINAALASCKLSSYPGSWGLISVHESNPGIDTAVPKEAPGKDFSEGLSMHYSDLKNTSIAWLGVSWSRRTTKRAILIEDHSRCRAQQKKISGCASTTSQGGILKIYHQLARCQIMVMNHHVFMT